MTFRYRTTLLSIHHKRAAFTCGVDALDRYFRHQVGQDWRRNLTVPYVLVDFESEAVIGFYTLSNASLLPADLPKEVIRKLPRYEAFPAILIGRLAVDRRFRGEGFGGLLLLDALRRCFEASQQIGAMAVVVDAKDAGATAFYEYYGFRRFGDLANRLYLPITDISRLFITE